MNRRRGRVRLAAAPEGVARPWRVGVLGANLTGLTCAYYLALAGATVDVLETGSEPDLPSSARADLPQVLAVGLRLVTGVSPSREAEGSGTRYDAVYQASSAWSAVAGTMLRPDGVMIAAPGDVPGVAGQVAAGRRAAITIYEALQGGLS